MMRRRDCIDTAKVYAMPWYFMPARYYCYHATTAAAGGRNIRHADLWRKYLSISEKSLTLLTGPCSGGPEVGRASWYRAPLAPATAVPLDERPVTVSRMVHGSGPSIGAVHCTVAVKPRVASACPIADVSFHAAHQLRHDAPARKGAVEARDPLGDRRVAVWIEIDASLH